MTRSRTRIARLEAAEAKLELFDCAPSASSTQPAFATKSIDQDWTGADLKPIQQYSLILDEIAKCISTADAVIAFTGTGFGPESGFASLNKTGGDGGIAPWPGLAED